MQKKAVTLCAFLEKSEQNNTFYTIYTMKKFLLLLPVVCLWVAAEARTDTLIRQVTDTLSTVRLVQDSVLRKREEPAPADSADRRGHYLEAHLGAGYGTLGYHLDANRNHVDGFVSGLIQLQYAWFFHPNVGIGAGLWFTNYVSHAYLTGPYKWLDQTDTDTEMHYDHTADVRRWNELQALHNVGIPVSIQFQYMPEKKKAGLFGSVGVAPSFSVMHTYRLIEGQIAHSGFYPAWNLTLENLHEFGLKNYEDDPRSRGDVSVRPQASVFADLGMLVRLNYEVDMFIGGYANICANDAHTDRQSDRKPLGWQDETFTFMDTYSGTYATNLAGPSHPWEAGLKIGIHWHHVSPQKGKTRTVDYYEYFTRRDTTYRYVTRQDTTVVVIPDAEDPHQARVHRVAKEINQFNKVYFAFDSYELSAEAKKNLDHIAEVLVKEPDVQISVGGHASPEGQSVYNDRLSRKRAFAVANYLDSKGVSKSRILIKHFGSRVPNIDEERKALLRDRRAEIIILESDNQ